MFGKSICLLALAAMTAQASAQEDTTIRRGADVLRGILIKPAAAAAAAPSVNDRGDLATVWLSPPMTRTRPGYKGASPQSFTFGAVNPDSVNTLRVTIQCYDRATGAAIAIYAGTIDLAPLGAGLWAPGGSKNVADVDLVWCALSAPARFAAFGYNSYVNFGDPQPVPMVAAAR